jgi:hypothetical protein
MSGKEFEKVVCARTNLAGLQADKPISQQLLRNAASVNYSMRFFSRRQAAFRQA